MKFVLTTLSGLACGLLALGSGCTHETAGADSDGTGSSGRRPQLGFVTNCVAEFWTIGQRGAEIGAKENGVDVIVRMPASGTSVDQQQILEDLLSRGVQGIAVSPSAPEHMTAFLDRIAERVPLITHDSDAPQSKRLCFIGVDNYAAGRMCGQLVKEALPEGGVVVLLVGTMAQDNAKLRRQGVVDELLDRSHDRTRFDPVDAPLKGARYEIRATFTDEFKASEGKGIAQDALARWSDLGCLVGLFEYEPPLLVEAVASAGRQDKVKVIGFDENESTLQGILDGTVHGTVVQDPYEYGRKSVELLSKLVREPGAAKRRALLPPGGYLEVPARQIKKDNVQAFWDDLKAKLKPQ